MTTLHLDHSSSVRISSSAPAYRILRRVVNTFYLWAVRARERRELSGLLAADDRVLKDLGLHQHVISQAALKPFWRD
jgi:uncharacterized protein YjiS (DUF1127 family)